MNILITGVASGIGHIDIPSDKKDESELLCQLDPHKPIITVCLWDTGSWTFFEKKGINSSASNSSFSNLS